MALASRSSARRQRQFAFNGGIWSCGSAWVSREAKWTEESLESSSGSWSLSFWW